MPTATIRLFSEGPSAPLIPSASTSGGKASSPSIRRHGYLIGPATQVAGEQAQRDAQQGGDHDRDHAHLE
jgi:hypothetical protein